MTNFKLSAARKSLDERVRRFARLTNNEELRSLMLRLSALILNRDCDEDITLECQALHGLVGDDLKSKITPLLAEYEARSAKNEEDRKRAESVRLREELIKLDKIRDDYFALPEEKLKSLWNDGDNELPKNEREIVRAALRSKLGIPHTLEL